MHFRWIVGALAMLGSAIIPAQYSPTLNSVIFQGWTTGGRPGSPSAGQCGYNTTLSVLECYTGSAWTAVVTSFNTRTGAITLGSGDVTGALGYTPVNPSSVGAANGIAPLDANEKVPYANLPASVQSVGLQLGWVGVPGASQISQSVAPFPCDTAANLAGSVSWVNTESTGTPAFALSIIHAGTPTTIGNATLSASSHVVTFPTTTAVDFVAGDVLQAVAPSSPDASAADITMTVYCSKTTP